MLATVEAVYEQTNEVFEDDLLQKAQSLKHDMQIANKDKMLALKIANLSTHISRLEKQINSKVATELGFQEFTIEGLARLLMQEEELPISIERMNSMMYEWFYAKEEFKKFIELFRRGEISAQSVNVIFKKRFFSKKAKKETCRFGSLNGLKVDIPYGVVLRINELKNLGIFSCFNVIAPETAWHENKYVDPIVVASIAEISPWGTVSLETMSHFFVAKW